MSKPRCVVYIALLKELGLFYCPGAINIESLRDSYYRQDSQTLIEIRNNWLYQSNF